MEKMEKMVMVKWKNKIKNKNLSFNHNANHKINKDNAVRVAKAEPTRLQGVQEGDAEVLLQARFNEADGYPANAGTVFERI
jgi:hypothetical protein